MPPKPAERDRALRAGDVQTIIRLFAGATEAQRREHAAAVMAWIRRIQLNEKSHYSSRARDQLAPGEELSDVHQLVPAAYAAVLACGTLAEVKSFYPAWALELGFVDVLKDRRPPWLDDYARFILDESRGRISGYGWRKVRSLVRAGLCRPPAHAGYVLGALEGIQPRQYEIERHRCEQAGLPLPEPPTMLDLLLAERDWLETAFWQLFELDGTGEVSLANHEKYGSMHYAWTEPLVELSRRGVLSRDRLLDASLAALSRDFIQFRAGWFSRFHEALRPTARERADRTDAYLALLASNIPPTVVFAIDGVTLADDERPIPAAKFLPALEPALNARGRAVVRSALDLLDRVAIREPSARPATARAAVTALLNPAIDVQRFALAWLEKHGDRTDADLRRRLDEVSGAVAASLRGRLQAWTAATPPATDRPASATVAITPPVTRAAAVPPPPAPAIPDRTDPSRAIIPLASFDELLDQAAAILETPENPDDIERLLAALVRFAPHRPADFARRVGPLARRAVKRVSPFSFKPHFDPIVQRSLAATVLSWLGDMDVFTRIPVFTSDGAEPFEFLLRRLRVIVDHVRRASPLPLLSAPTHRDGWIAPAALVERWCAWQQAGTAPDLHEQVVALLRLAPERRAEALPAAAVLTGESGAAVRHALGQNSRPGQNVALWLAAYRSHQPFGDLPGLEQLHPHLGPDAGRAAEYTWVARGESHGTAARVGHAFSIESRPPRPEHTDSACLPVLWHTPSEGMGSSSRTLVRWMAHLWPSHRESFFAHGLPRLQRAVDWSDNGDRETPGYLEPLLEPHTELRPMAGLALALGLAAQDPALRGHAQDALIAVISDGRLDAAVLGAAMARLLYIGNNKLMRWAKSLAEVARVSPRHAAAVADVLPRILHADPARAPRDLGALLELLVELSSETGLPLSDPQARAYLGALNGSGKVARLARQLLRG